MPKVSIIIPIFNAESCLIRAVESCLAQSFSDFEVILVDDKSVDKSLQIALAFSMRDSRVIVVENPRNLGTFLARKNGAQIANGKFIVFLDADDYLRPNALEILCDLADKNRADMVHCGIITEPFLPHSTKPKIHTQTLENDAILGKIFVCDFKKSWLIVCGKMFSANLMRHALKKLEFIDCHLISSEDSLLFFMLCALAQKSVGTRESLYIYTQNLNSLLKSKEPTIIAKQVADRASIRYSLRKHLAHFRNDSDLAKNRYFEQSLQNLCDLMDYFICYSMRFLDSRDLDSHNLGKKSRISPYIKYSILSFRFVARWQIAVKLAIFLLTRKKL